MLAGRKAPYTPHPFSKEELKAFFQTADSLRQYNHVSERVSMLRKIEIPVFYRLLYSTGMRTVEARMLNREDVDLQNGIINITGSKGISQHRIALHKSIWDLLIRYDEKMSCLKGVLS
jgi:integrase